MKLGEAIFLTLGEPCPKLSKYCLLRNEKFSEHGNPSYKTLISEVNISEETVSLKTQNWWKSS